MKGFALIPILLVALASVGVGAFISTVYDLKDHPATDSNDPVEIVATAAAHTPWDAVYDLFFGGIFGVFVWIVQWGVVPLMNWVASVTVRHQVEFPMVFGYFVLSFFILFMLWKKKDSIWEFVTHKLFWAIIILAVVFVLGVFVVLLGGI